MKIENLTIIKIGGSVATYKDNVKVPALREGTIRQLAKELNSYLKKEGERIILVNGAGSFGHPLAKKYDLSNLNKKQKNKLGVSLTHYSAQKLNYLLGEIFLKENCPVFHLSPASLIKQKNGRIVSFLTASVKSLLNQSLIPFLHGDVVMDESCQFSICSGDQIVAYLSNLYSPKRVFFLTDVDGIFTDNPKMNKKAKLIKEIKRKELLKIASKIKNNSKFDVTNSMRGKLQEIADIKSDIYIFNGLLKNNLLKSLKGEGTGTKISA